MAKSEAAKAADRALAILREHYPACVVLLPPEAEEADRPPTILHRGPRSFWRGLLGEAFEVVFESDPPPTEQREGEG